MIRIHQIQTEEEYDQAIEMVDALAAVGFDHLGKEQEDLLAHLARIIEVYEKKHYPI